MMQQHVIVGGGLVGSLLAALLADRGLPVTVYEQRDDPREAAAAGGRSINLVLTRRGIRGLGLAGLAEQALALTVPVTGRMMHAVNGELTFQPYGRDESECNYSISRSGLNRFLIEAAEHRGARFRFGARLKDADLAQGRLCFVRTDESVEEITARVVFGTDGAASAVRGALERMSGFEVSVDLLDYGYKELTIPPGDDGGFRLEPNALHIWPRQAFMLMALPNIDGSFTVTLYMPERGERGFEALDAPRSVRALFEREFPDAVPLLPQLEAEMLGNPTGVLGTVRVAPWHFEDRVLLLGDAAHAIVPFFGQGMNSGFEDCTVLSQLLDEHGTNSWVEVFAELSRRRKPNADAIADMALENFVEMRDLVGDAAFLLRKGVEHRLELEMPETYRSRYSMVMYSHIPFRTCLDAGRIQQALLDELCGGLDSPEQLDLRRARERIVSELTPFLERSGVSLDY